MMKNVVKITSGILRGRLIATPGGKTHPMGERERLALFNVIFAYLPDAVVLDAYAGSGALGIEALSRGASIVVFIDQASQAVSCINDNLRTLGYFTKDDKVANVQERKGKVEVIRAKAGIFTTTKTFDVILADPPYDQFMIDGVLHLTKYLKPGGILVLSHPNLDLELPGLILKTHRKYAGAMISVFVKE